MTTMASPLVGRHHPRRGFSVRARAVEEPKSKPPPTTPYRGALFPGVEVPEAGADAWRSVSSIFPWGNGAPVTEGVLGDLLKEEVRAAPLFIPLYNYYREYGGVYNLGAGPKWFVVVSDPVAVRHMFKDNADAFSKGILTDIMAPIMGDGLIPAPKEIWAKRRPTVGAGFHGAWLKHMVKGGRNGGRRGLSSRGDTPIRTVSSFRHLYVCNAVCNAANAVILTYL